MVKTLHLTRHIVSLISSTVILLLQSVPKVKLVGFYLLDSIVKNVKGPYVAHFQRNLTDLFLSTYSVADANMRKSMLHLFSTWKAVFAQSVLSNIDRVVHASKASVLPAPHSQQQMMMAQRLAGGAMPAVQQPMGSMMTGGAFQPMGATQQPTGTNGYGYLQQPMGAGVSVGAGGMMNGQQWAPQMQPMGGSGGGYSGGGYSGGSSFGALPPPPQQISAMPQAGGYQQPSYQQQSGGGGGATNLNVHGMDPSAAGSLLAKMVQGGGDVSALLSSIAAAKAKTSSGREGSPAVSGFSGGAVTGLSGAATGGSPTGSGGSGNGSGPPPPCAPPGKPRGSKRAGSEDALSTDRHGDKENVAGQIKRLTADFDPAVEHGEEGELKKRRKYLIDAMYGDRPHQCAQTGRRFADRAELDAHLDLMHMRRRKKKEGNVSRRWCVDADSWVAGARAEAADDAPAFFASEAAAAEAAASAETSSVLVDESQPNCALSGEPFEVFWNAEEDEWHYRAAMRLEKAVGAVPAGRIVLVTAVPRDEGEKMLVAVAEGQAVADDLAEAADTIETVEPEEMVTVGNKRVAEANAEEEPETPQLGRGKRRKS